MVKVYSCRSLQNYSSKANEKELSKGIIFMFLFFIKKIQIGASTNRFHDIIWSILFLFEHFAKQVCFLLISCFFISYTFYFRILFSFSEHEGLKSLNARHIHLKNFKATTDRKKFQLYSHLNIWTNPFSKNSSCNCYVGLFLGNSIKEWHVVKITD